VTAAVLLADQRAFAGSGSTTLAEMPGRGRPTVPARDPVRQGRYVDGHDRRHLGAAVALDQIDAELV